MKPWCARALFLTYRLPHSPLQAAREYRALRVSSRAFLDGFPVLHYPPAENEALVTEKVNKALTLISSVDSRRYRRLRSDIHQILIGATTRSAQYWTITQTCALSRHEVLTRSVATIALMLVHEGAHARLNTAGLYPWPSVRARLEKRCFSEERSFALLLQERGYSDIGKLLLWLDTISP